MSTQRRPLQIAGTEQHSSNDGILFIAVASALAASSINVAESSDDKSDSARWEGVIESCVPAVVSIKVNATRSFDTNSPGASQATGFIVDADKGLVLTNRHVVQSGPVIADAVFHNHEEVPLRAVYRDPVHDFGLFQFDPKKLKHLKGPLPELKLHPEAARVGMEIRVMGNNAGEKLSILGGTLARLDRQAPQYGRSSFNDHNTFYFQAASNTSGGSSGSPVINADGKVVGLNAAGLVGTASSYYLPLDRVKRAVDLIKAGKPVSRGTLQTTFLHKPFNDLHRVGLPSGVEAQGTGALAGLEPGDVLLKLGGQVVTLFTDLEEMLDSKVGEDLEMVVLRGGVEKVLKPTVECLHSITPASFIEMGDSVFHDLSYHMARNHSTPVKESGVYICQSGYMLRMAGVNKGSLIVSVNNVPTPNLASLEKVFKSLEDGAVVPMRVRHVSSPHLSVLVMITVDKSWFTHQRMDRVEVGGTWSKEEEDWAVTTYAPQQHTNKPLLSLFPNDKAEASSAQVGAMTKFPPGRNDAERAVANSLVQVYYNMPYSIDGTAASTYRGTGMVVDAERGLVVVDRNTVTSGLGDVLISFGSSCEVSGKVVFIHPLHNLAVIGYDPKLLGKTPVKAVELAQGSNQGILPPKIEPLKVFKDESDDAVKKRSNNSNQFSFVTLSGNRRTGSQLVSKSVTLSPLTHAQPVAYSHPPRFQETNLETMLVEGAGANDGVIVNGEGKVAAYWASFAEQVVSQGKIVNSESFQGLPAELITELIEPLKKGEVPKFRTLGTECEYIGLSQVRGMGLDHASINAIANASPRWPPRLLAVKRRWGGCPAFSLLQDGDVILSISGKVVSSFREVEVECNSKESVDVELLRDGKKQTINVGTMLLPSDETSQLLFWGGAVLQAAPSAVARQRAIVGNGVYVASSSQGSPANKFGLQPTSRIIEVDGQPVKDLVEFIEAVKYKKNGDSVRIKQEDLRGVRGVSSLKLDLTYWPTYEVTREYDIKSNKNIENRFTWTRKPLPPIEKRQPVICK